MRTAPLPSIAYSRECRLCGTEGAIGRLPRTEFYSATHTAPTGAVFFSGAGAARAALPSRARPKRQAWLTSNRMRQVLEARVFAAKRRVDGSDFPIAVLRHDQFSRPVRLGLVRLGLFVAMYEDDHIGILFDRP